VITLTGAVEWQYQRDAAHDAVASLPGLVGINNLILLQPPITVSPEKAKSNITAALVRNARVDARRIRVDVTGSQVTLTGPCRHTRKAAKPTAPRGRPRRHRSRRPTNHRVLTTTTFASQTPPRKARHQT